MKKIFFLLTNLVFCINALAQIDRNAGSLSIQDYEGTAAVIIKDNFARIQKGDQVDSFAIVKTSNAINLADAGNTEKIYTLLQLSATQLEQSLSDQAGNDPIAKLLDIASKMNEQKLIIQAAGASSAGVALEEAAEPAPIVVEQSGSSWILPSLIGLAALVIGFLAGKAVSKKTAVQAPIQEIKDVSEVKVAPVKESVSKTSAKKLEQLNHELEAVKEKNKLISEKTQKLIDGDNFYYNAVFEQIILPLQSALDNGDEAEVVKYLNLAMVHLSSITRVKIRKKQNYDDANIQLITGNASLTQDFPFIDAQTPIDKIPANLRVLVQILQKSGVSGLGETVVKGYKIKDL